MTRTAWILSAYDPARELVGPPAPITMHADVLVCLFAGLTRIADIAKQLDCSKTYVIRLLDDLAHFGLVGQRRMPGRGMRMEFFAIGETT